MMKWKWFTGALRYSDNCVGCGKKLIYGADAGIVDWGDDAGGRVLDRFHVMCLLDRLALEMDALARAQVKDTTVYDPMIGWGRVSPP